MYLTVIVSFDAAHKLYMDEKSDDENKDVYGKCVELHGHTYRLHISIKGSVQKNGMIMNFKEAKEIAKSVIEPLDHGFLNDFIPLPTAENLIAYLWNKMELCFSSKGIVLDELVLFEKDDSFITMNGV